MIKKENKRLNVTLEPSHVQKLDSIRENSALSFSELVQKWIIQEYVLKTTWNTKKKGKNQHV